MYKQLERYREFNRQIRIAKYVRCSSDEQKKNGYTINDQLDLIEEFAKEHELISAGTYVDEGISATLEISKRKDLAQLIKDAKAGKFDIVIFKCIDRFFRSVGEYYECQKQLRKAGVTWISIEESDLDPEDDDAAFKINIYLTMAEYEARKTSKRIRFNNKMRIKNKQVVTGAQCFHFPWKVEGEKKNRHLVKNEEKAHILMDLLNFFEMHQSKSATLGYINIKYALTMSMGTLEGILKDTLLYGEYKGVADYVEPYITKERFNKIQEILTRNARVYTESNRIYLFSGMFKCPHCHKKMAGTASKANQKYECLSYRCNDAKMKKICDYTMTNSEKKIEKQLITNLDKYINYEISRIEDIKEIEAPAKRNQEAEIEKLKKEMDRLNMMFRKGRIEEEEYDKEYLNLERALGKLTATENEQPQGQNLDALKGLLETDYKTLYDNLDRQHKKAFWRNLIKEFTVDENKKIIPESIIFF